MSLTSRLFLQYLCRSKWQRRYNTLANVSPKDIQNDTVSIQNEPFQTFRTIESNPINHNEQHLNRLYTIPDNIVQTFYKINGIPANYLRLANTFNECSLLVRNPTIEILSYLEQADYSRPINKYLLYGKYGTGKSLAITHILHYAFMKEMIIVHVPTPTHWFKNPKEIANSTTMPGIIDLPVDAGKWLLYFKSQNEKLLSKLDLRISKDYQWNIRELSPKGTPLLEIIDFGINRVRYATGVIDALCTELKESSIAGKCKVLVAVDGYNSFWSNHTRIRNDAKVWMKSQQISLTLSFLNFVKADWCNGAAVLVVDSKICKDRKEYVNPRFLLGKEGFEFTDPFLPILVENYNKTEFESIMEYYNDRKWVRNITSEGLAEIWALTAGNPCEIMKFCRSL
ncbi:PREDICTED: 28S ribosomal protein S29, mitochondrial [Polistes dominula]|uniref:Small ribosomal subunit protein mS29 n=1 Tax=Polistes dominula TaxID=743375 RepID=A0ABM1IE99_POLDO|nr:PREDICTED: 28S ribosomal protein S29, mitochondrial [Polistes dominula]